MVSKWCQSGVKVVSKAYVTPMPGTMEQWMVSGPCPCPEPQQTTSGPPPIDWTKSYYEILDVSRSARESTIRAAFKRLAARYHPDKAGPHFTETFQRLNHIHSILINSKERSAYNKDPFGFTFPGDGTNDAANDDASSEKEKKVEIVATCVDYVDVATLEFFASLKAANFIILEDDDKHVCNETLRSRAFVELRRLDMAKKFGHDGVVVPYHEDKLSLVTGTKGRLTPGLTNLSLATGQYYADALSRLCEEGITTWQATRSLHAGPKYFKEIARGPTQVLDADRKKSFPNAVLDRHPDLDAVEMWTIHPEAFAAACRFDVSDPMQYKLVKDFCNSAAGSGSIFEKEWLAKARLTQLPDVMILYREQLRVAAQRDTAARPQIAKTLAQQGWKETDIQNKTHYICNSEIERRESDAALGRRQKLTETVAQLLFCTLLNSYPHSVDWAIIWGKIALIFI